MVTIQIKLILPIFLAFVICCQSENLTASSSWAKLQISSDSLSSIEYDNFRIEIYEHVNNQKSTTTANQKKYFYSPLALLEYNSAVSVYNKFKKQPEMRFRLEMWNDKIQNEVVQHLNEIVGHEIKSNKVAVIPFEKVILTSNVPKGDYSLSPEWTNYDKSKTLWFYLSCYDQKVCDELAEEIRSDPTQLHHVKLLYSFSSQTSQTKRTTINIDSVTSGQMVSNILQKFEDKKEIFLTANDEKKMLAETATNIRMDTFEDSEVASPDTESQISNILKDLMVVSRTTIKEISDKIWDSVFWYDDNYRPDKTMKSLNEIIKTLDKETQKKLADMFQKAEKQLTVDKQNRNKERVQHNYDSNSWADVDIISTQISGKLVNDPDSSLEIVKDEVEKLLQESKNHVQWDGEKFVPKPLQLCRINLDIIRDPQSFQDRNIRVRYTNADMSSPIRFMEQAQLNVTNEWKNLKEELKEAVMEFREVNNELSKVKKDLTNQLEGTKQELETMRANVDDLSTKLNDLAAEKEWTETKIRSGNLSTELVNLKINLQRLGHEIKIVENNLKKELRANLNQLETATTNLVSKAELSSTNSAVADLTKKINARTNEIVDIGKMPTSCFDLQQMGHKLSGFFTIKGSKKMEMVYCDFYQNQNDKQKLIGYADVKSAPVHFYVQRNSNFATKSTPIPFELERVNEGKAMDLTSGKFTAPRPGIYYFSFTGHAGFPVSSVRVFLGVGLYLNGGRIALGFVQESKTVDQQWSPLTFQSTLNLKKGDQVWLEIYSIALGVVLHDENYHNTHFTGFVLEEEIVASL